MKRVLFYSFVLCIGDYAFASSIADSWRYSSASYAAQKENWEGAYNQLSNLLINNYDRADLLYDAGVAAYRNSNFEQARSYFERALTVCTDPALQERIHFNLGNAHVAVKQLEKALTDYENVLKLNKDNAQAKHNWQKVKEMLEKQKQQQQQQDQENKEDQKNDQQQDQDKQDNKDQQNKQDGSKDNNQQEQKQQGDQQEQNDGQQQGGGDQQQQKKDQQNKNGTDQKPDTDVDKKQDEQQGKGKEETEQEKKQQQKEGTQEQQKQANEQEQKERGDKGSEKKSADQKKEQEKGKAKGMQGASSQEPLQQIEHPDATAQFGEREQWMVKILEAQEDADKKANKQFMKSSVNKKLGGTNGKNNW